MPTHRPWRIIQVNLTNRSTLVEEIPFNNLRQFLGGRVYGVYTPLREIPPAANPLGPENKPIFATGVLTYSKLASSSRFSVLTKSPHTGGDGEAETGGWWRAGTGRCWFQHHHTGRPGGETGLAVDP